MKIRSLKKNRKTLSERLHCEDYKKTTVTIALLLTLVIALSITIPTSAEELTPAPYQPIIDLCSSYLYKGISIAKDSMISALIQNNAGTDNYDLINFDKDGVPEMVLVGCYHDRPYEVLDICTIQSGEVVKLFEATEKDKAFITKLKIKIKSNFRKYYYENTNFIELSILRCLN